MSIFCYWTVCEAIVTLSSERWSFLECSIQYYHYIIGISGLYVAELYNNLSCLLVLKEESRIELLCVLFGVIRKSVSESPVIVAFLKMLSMLPGACVTWHAIAHISVELYTPSFVKLLTDMDAVQLFACLMQAHPSKNILITTALQLLNNFLQCGVYIVLHTKLICGCRADDSFVQSIWDLWTSHGSKRCGWRYINGWVNHAFCCRYLLLRSEYKVGNVSQKFCMYSVGSYPKNQKL